MAAIRSRANTFKLAFAFLDENGDPASVASATCQLVWEGLDDYGTIALALLENAEDQTWDAAWDSSVARPGWVDYHAHAIGSSGDSYTEDGRWKIAGNKASLQHDKLPKTASNYDNTVT